MRSGLAKIGILGLALVVACCGGQPPASASTSPTTGGSAPLAVASTASAAASAAPAAASTVGLPAATATPPLTASPSPTARPTPPAGLSRIASATHDGITLRIELQRNPLPAGELSWVKVTLSNTGSNVVTWFHDGCARLAGVGGVQLGVWPGGKVQTGNAAVFKGMALMGDPTALQPSDATMSFEPKDHLGKGSYGCSDIGISDRIAAGESKTQTFWWDGRSGVGLPMPAGPLTLRVFGEFYWRGTKEPAEIVSDETQFRFELKSWVVGGREGLLSPGQTVDAALADAGFAAEIAPLHLQEGMSEFAWYHPEMNRWEIGYILWGAEPYYLHGVVVDASTGQVVAKLLRPWDQQADPFP